MHTNTSKAFTMAETLITLGIIGIVAAMTLPIIIQNYKKNQAVSQLKSSYSILFQAVRMSELENGESKYWDYGLLTEDFFKKYLKPYLKFLNITRNSENNIIVYKWLNNTSITSGYKEESPNSIVGTLANGSMIIIHTEPNYLPTIMIDINGHKNPNKVGIDLFHFSISPDYGFVPWGYGTGAMSPDIPGFGNTYDRNELIGTMEYACNKTQKGRWCAALIISDGWKISKDYPWQ